MNLPAIFKILSVGPCLRVRSRDPAFARRSPLSALGLLVLLWLCAAPDYARAQVPPPREPLTVMSFNIRYGTAPDGENHWTGRREMLFDLVREQKADVIGLQEALDSQIREISAAVPGYAVVGVGRDDALAKGEYSAILFRTDRLHVAESGTFWFSDTPEVAGSKSWGNNITRICTWARFVDRDGRGFWHFNLHLDHQSQPSRERSTELLRRRIEARAFPDQPVVVTGDFNVGERNPALRSLVASARAEGAAAQSAPLLVDTFRVVHPDERVVGTFSGFKFGQVNGEKIDYVLVAPGTEVLSADILRTSRNDRYPSDHFPVVATVRLR
jgi:endonuclease/exonuclease/phosphatase family metal-dependent hydrolase